MKRIVLGTVVAALAALAAPTAARAGVSMGTVEESPTAAREVWREKAETDYKEGMKARAAGDQKNAVRLLLRVAKMGRMRMDSPYPEMAHNEVKVITEEARKEMVVARQLIAGEDREAGVSELRRIMRTYFGLFPAKEAGTLLRQLESDPSFQAALRAGQLDDELDKAADLEAEGAALLKPPEPELPPDEADPSPGGSLPTTPPPAPPPEGVHVAAVAPKALTEKERRAARIEKLAAAYDIYCRVAKKGAGTEPGKKADAARRRLEQDADLLARIRLAQRTDQAKEWLSLANNYFRAGRFDSAREYCKKIIAECPDTPQAVDARLLLKGIK